MPIKVAAKFCAPHSYCKYLCKVFDIMSAFNAYQLQLKLCQSFWFSCADKCRLRVAEPQTRRRRERGIQHMANAVNYAMISMFQPTCFYGATHIQFLANSRRDRQQTSCPFPFAHSQLNFLPHWNWKRKRKSEQFAEMATQRKESKVGVSLKRQFYFIYLFLLLPPKLFSLVTIF